MKQMKKIAKNATFACNFQTHQTTTYYDDYKLMRRTAEQAGSSVEVQNANKLNNLSSIYMISIEIVDRVLISDSVILEMTVT